MDPNNTIDPASEETGITTIDQANVQAAAAPQAPVISAKDAFGLDESPRESLVREQTKVDSQVPQDKAARDEHGRFVKPGAKKDDKAATVTKPAAAAPAKPTAPVATQPAAKPEDKAPAKPAESDELKNEIKALKEELAKIKSTAAQPQQQTQQQAAPTKAEPSPEETAKLENEFVSQMAANIADIALTEEGLEQILVGGKEGIAALNGLLKSVAARSVLEARKSIYGELNPIMSQLTQRVSPLIENNQQLEMLATETAFMAKYPEYFGDTLKEAQDVAKALWQMYPEIVSKMTREQFIDEVDKQTDARISEQFKKYHPTETRTWREWSMSRKQAASAPTGATAPAAPSAPAAPAQPAAQAPAAPSAPAKPTVKPPAANSPGSVTGAPRDWQKGVASSLLG